MAIRRDKGHLLHIVNFLVENSSSLDVATVDGNTALHYCCMYNQSECAKLLLRSGANANIENKDKKTPLDLAKEYASTLCEDFVRSSSSFRSSRVQNDENCLLNLIEFGWMGWINWWRVWQIHLAAKNQKSQLDNVKNKTMKTVY